MSERFTVEVDIRAKDSTGKALSGAKRGFKDAFQEIASGALRKAGEELTSFAKNIPAMIVDLGKLGIQSQAVTQRFERFAGSAGQAEEFLESFNKGTQNTVDRMSAMSSAGRLLQMGLVGTGDEMEQVSSIATKLGDQTMGAGDRISDFAALLANQSIPRLDNFGISSGRVRQRIDELLKSGQALNREEAFKMAVMEEGAKALTRLGDTSNTAAQKTAVLQAALQDAKVGFGELLISMVETSGSVDGFASRIRNLPQALQQTTAIVKAATLALNELKMKGFLAKPVETFTDSLKRSAIAQMDVNHVSEVSRFQHLDTTRAVVQESVAIETQLTPALLSAQRRMDAVSAEQDELAIAAAGASEALSAEAAAVQDFVGGMDAFQQLQLSVSFTGQLDRMQESAENFAKKREDIETEHQSALAELQKRGQATAIRINEAAEMEKLADLQFRMEQAQRRLEEMTGKEKESARLAKENTLAEAQEKFQKQQQLLDNFHAGRLVKAGENVNGLIAEEDRRHQAAIAGLDAEMEKQQQIQEQALGNMVLQSFDAWSEQKDIPVAKMLEMRVGIAEEFGLVSEDATELVTDMVGEWDRWAENTNIATEDVIDLMGQVVTETGEIDKALLALTTEEHVIRIRIETSGSVPDMPGNGTGGGARPGGGIPMANGGRFLVGERGPEVVTVQPMNVTNNDTFNIFDPGAMSAVQDRRRRERRQEMARSM